MAKCFPHLLQTHHPRKVVPLMSRYSGKQSTEKKAKGQHNKGIARAVKTQKRVEAEARDALTLPERRRSAHRYIAEERVDELVTTNKRVRRSRRQYVAQKQS